jgi:hypothetical protein
LPVWRVQFMEIGCQGAHKCKVRNHWSTVSDQRNVVLSEVLNWINPVRPLTFYVFLDKLLSTPTLICLPSLADMLVYRHCHAGSLSVEYNLGWSSPTS